ncbi:MAG: ABC transporter ATP-binding protein [Desulfobacula sp.]|jgi:branched-chain amino acid transport system ATP-binding protein|nr:ABC transporter ATP-binding protein [Desulfobacula sp.]
MFNIPYQLIKKAMMMLKCKNVTKKFGNITAIDDMSFTVEKDEIFGIAGPNGSGKTTLFNLITGVYSFSGGIFLGKENISGLRPYSICHKGIARTFQIPQLSLSLPVYDNIRAGAHFGARTNPHEEKRVIQDMLDLMDLGSKSGITCANLTLLDKKLTMIATALATQPRLLLLDEPIAGLNPSEIQQTTEMLKKINQELGITLIIIEHFMKVLTALSSRMMIIENGKLICIGSPEDVMSNQKVIDCYLGKSYA